MRYLSAAERTFRTAMKELERVVVARVRMQANERYAEAVRARQASEAEEAAAEIGSVSQIQPVGRGTDLCEATSLGQSIGTI